MNLHHHLSILVCASAVAAAQPSTERIGIENDDAKINADAEKASKIPLRPAAEITQRAGMPNLFTKLAKGEPVMIAYYGGSITAGPGWRNFTLDWFAEQYPKVKITEPMPASAVPVRLSGCFARITIFATIRRNISTTPSRWGRSSSLAICWMRRAK